MVKQPMSVAERPEKTAATFPLDAAVQMVQLATFVFRLCSLHHRTIFLHVPPFSLPGSDFFAMYLALNCTGQAFTVRYRDHRTCTVGAGGSYNTFCTTDDSKLPLPAGDFTTQM